MNFETPALISRLPRVGATIFSTMSALAQAHGAVNLGQGFPDFDCDPALIEAVHQAMRAGHNQYPPMPGVPALREAVAAKLLASHGMAYCPEREITITAGATQAILTALLAIVHPSDEVMVLEPCYDSYAPNVELAGGVLVRVPLDPHSFRPDFERIRAALSPRTRAIIINTPHNPSATVWSAEEMLSLAELLRGTSVLLISDEVYEHMVFDGAAHQSVARFPELAARSLIVSSFGKTFHATGWKVGYVAAPASLSAEFRKVHQYTVFSVNTPVQLGLARYLEDPRPHQTLPAFYQRKRDHFRAGLAASRLRLLPCSGSYFQCVEYRELGQPSELNDGEFCQWLTREVGVAAIPISAFHNSAEDQMRASELKIIRFCFAKQDSTLDRALTLLSQL